jgi:hypothetical protein
MVFLAGDRAGNLRNSDVLLGLVECVENGATVVSMSFGGRGRSTIEDGFYRQLYLSGIVLVAAAGNSGNKGNAIDYPAGYDWVISVGAVDSQRGVGLFSSYNDQLSLTAPGVEVRSLWATSDSSYVSASGTSMAAPYVSGVAALLVSLFPWATVTNIREAMEQTALDTGACGYDPLCTCFYTGGLCLGFPKFQIFLPSVSNAFCDLFGCVLGCCLLPTDGHGQLDALAAARFLQALGRSSTTVASSSTSGSLPRNCKIAQVSVTTDKRGHQTTWFVADPLGRIVYRGGPYEEGVEKTYTKSFFIPELETPNECYTFAIVDEAGDG